MNICMIRLCRSISLTGKKDIQRILGLERIMFGLSNRLLDQKDKYVDRQFSLEITGNKEVGKIRATVTVFKVKNEEKIS